MKNWKSFLKLLILLAAMSNVHAISAQSPPPQTSSAPSSPTSGTSATRSEPAASAAGQFDKTSAKTNWPPAYAGGSDPIAACSAVADELAASRILIDALENENAALKRRLDTEKRTTSLLTELNETREAETEALRTAIAAKSEALTAKDAVIASQDKLIETLKRKKSSTWKRIANVLIGVGLGSLLR
jgi:septal ring factor EnvC (AmiA/AmiB activator)